MCAIRWPMVSVFVRFFSGLRAAFFFLQVMTGLWSAFFCKFLLAYGVFTLFCWPMGGVIFFVLSCLRSVCGHFINRRLLFDLLFEEFIFELMTSNYIIFFCFFLLLLLRGEVRSPDTMTDYDVSSRREQ